jgi:dUTP pyrophosphatase
MVTFALVKKLHVNIINRSSNSLPAYATEGSSGMDIKADLPGEVILQPLERILIPTGIYLEIPQGYEAQVRPRSGLAIKHGLTCLNTPGTIDADYRGEVKVILVNLSNEAQTIYHGDRIAQLVFARIEQVELLETTTLNSTERGQGGFGHTGKN